MKLSNINIAIRKSLNLFLTELLTEIIQSGVINVVKIINKIENKSNSETKIFHVVRNKDVEKLAKNYGEDAENGFNTSKGFQRLIKEIEGYKIIKQTSGYTIFMKE